MSPEKPLSIPAVRRKWVMEAGTVVALLLGTFFVVLTAVSLFPAWGVIAALGAFWTFLGTVSRLGLGRLVIMQHAVLPDRLVRKYYPGIARLVEGHARAVGIPVPEIMLLHPQSLSACAWGSGRRTGVALCITLVRLPPNLVSAMLAHEIAHLRNKDEAVFNCIVALVKSLLAATRWFLVGFAVHVGWLLFFRPQALPDPVPLLLFGLTWLALLALVSVGVAFWLPCLLRQHERAADALGAVITGDPVSLALVLTMLGPDDPDEKPGGRWISSHPLTQERVNDLMRLMIKMENKP